MPDKVKSILDEFLHSDLASRQDNYRKRRVVLALPPDVDTGEIEYCVHWQRELRSNWKSLFVLLTGTDTKGKSVEGLEPTSWWRQIARLTSSPKRPQGIMGSPHLLSKHACRCLVGACISQCSCPHCTTFLENLDHRHLAVRCGWRKTPVCVPVPSSASALSTSSNVCRECGGHCRDPDGAWLQMSAGLIPFLRHILCPPVSVPNVSLASVDPTTGLEIPGESSPIKLVRRKCWLGECADCGWDKRFANFPVLPVTIKEDDFTNRVEYVRACPAEAREDRYTSWHEFRLMERGNCEDGSAYTQPEWTPITGTRRMFYYQLHQFMKVSYLSSLCMNVLWHAMNSILFVVRCFCHIITKLPGMKLSTQFFHSSTNDLHLSGCLVSPSHTRP